MADIKIVVATADDKPAIGKDLAENFFVDEPLHKCYDLGHTEFFESYCLGIIDDGFSVKAVDVNTGEIAGFFISKFVTKAKVSSVDWTVEAGQRASSSLSLSDNSAFTT